MKIACLCPTFGKPILLANALAQFQAQTHPIDERKFFILDDAGQFGLANGLVQQSPEFELWSASTKFHTLPAKYHFLAQRALDWKADAICVWDDDDIYLPTHLEDHATVLKDHTWSHPLRVWSLYTGQLVQESAHGRFHAAVAFRRTIGDEINYWGSIDNGRCDYDQGLLGRLRRLALPGESQNPPTFVMRWGSTQADHCSGRCKSPDDVSWYRDTPISQPGRALKLAAKMDSETRSIYSQLSLSPYFARA